MTAADLSAGNFLFHPVQAPSLALFSTSGSNQAAIPVAIAAALTDVGTSEVLMVTISGVPSGATLSAGVKNLDGTWTLTGVQLNNLMMMPPADFDGVLNLTVTATAMAQGGASQASTAGTLAITITNFAPALSVEDALGVAGSAIALKIAAALTAADGPGSSLSVTVVGLPSGSTLSAGTRQADGSWNLTLAQLSGVSLIVPAGSFAGTAFLTVTATATEADGSQASRSANLGVTVAAVAIPPTLNLASVLGQSGTPIALNIATAVAGTDGQESLTSIRISGLPSGATLSAGTPNADGSWTLTAAQLSGLTLMVPPTLAVSFMLSVTSTVGESSNGSTASAVGTQLVVVNPSVLSTSGSGVVLQGSTSNQNLISTGSNNTLVAGGSNDVLVSGAGNNTLIGVAIADGTNHLIVGAGISIADYANAPSGVTVDLGGGTARNGRGGLDRLINIEEVIGSAFNDTLVDTRSSGYGSSGDITETLLGSTLIGGGGPTTLSDSRFAIDVNGHGVVGVSPPDDDHAFLGDLLIAGNGSDVLVDRRSFNATASTAYYDPDTLVGGSGTDTLLDSKAIDMPATSTPPQPIFYSDTLIGGSGHELLIDNESFAGAGPAFNSIGGTLIGGSGIDTLIDGRTFTTNSVSPQVTGDTLIAGTGTDVLIDSRSFFVFPNTSIMSRREVLIGSSGTDTLIDSMAGLTSYGDALVGGSGTETLIDARSITTHVDPVATTLMGGSGSNLIILNRSVLPTTDAGGSGGKDYIAAGSGALLVEYLESDVVVNLGSGVNGTAASSLHNTHDVLRGVSKVVVSGNNDTLIGITTGHDFLAAGSGSNIYIQSTGTANTLVGGSGMSTLSASGTADTLIAGRGTTTMIGTGTGSFYQFGAGAGQARIGNGSSSSSSASNELDFGPGISDNQLWFQRSGNDLQIDVMGTNNSIDVANWFVGAGSQLQEITTSDGMKMDSQVAQLVQAMATYSAANPTFNPVTTTQSPNDPALQTAIAAAWHR